MIPKGDTIAEIMRINRSARAEFLSEFSSDDLSRYLDRLRPERSVERTIPTNPTPSPGAAALRSAARITQKDAPFRFTPDGATV